MYPHLLFCSTAAQPRLQILFQSYKRRRNKGWRCRNSHECATNFIKVRGAIARGVLLLSSNAAGSLLSSRYRDRIALQRNNQYRTAFCGQFPSIHELKFDVREELRKAVRRSQPSNLGGEVDALPASSQSSPFRPTSSFEASSPNLRAQHFKFQSARTRSWLLHTIHQRSRMMDSSSTSEQARFPALVHEHEHSQRRSCRT